MTDTFDIDARRAIRSALARDAYHRKLVRITDADMSGFGWLVASHRGVFAVSRTRFKRLVHGWFFGICRDGDLLYLFENCGLRDRSVPLGRIVTIRIADRRLTDPQVIVTGLANNCHQVRIIDGLLCVVDTGSQVIRRFTPDGRPVDVKMPFPVATPDDTSGAYLHLNSIARIGERIAVMRHNGKAMPEKPSELAWLDADWRPTEIQPLAGHWCHDIVADEQGILWHSASKEGEIFASDGRRARISDQLMTRAIAITPDTVAVGISTFGARWQRDALRGAIVFLDRALADPVTLELPASPTDIVVM